MNEICLECDFETVNTLMILTSEFLDKMWIFAPVCSVREEKIVVEMYPSLYPSLYLKCLGVI